MNLDDVFSGVFFSPEGDLLDIPSEEDDDGNSLNLTLSSATISDGARHPQFAQFAVLGGCASRESVADLEQFMTPLFKPEEEQPQQAGGVASVSSVSVAPSSAAQTSAVQQLAAEMPGQAGSAGGQGLAPAPALGVVVGGTTADARPPLQVEVGAAAPLENTAGAAAAAAAEARAAQETAVLKAAEAVKAATAHAQVGACAFICPWRI